MLLKNEIISEKLVLLHDGSHIDASENYRPTGYDVSVGKIIDINGKEISGKSYKLKPQSIVWIISDEIIDLSSRNITAYVSIKTGLCNDGALALNTGIVDPGYKGLLSTAFVNFGKEDVKISKGDQFLRVTFHFHRVALETSTSNKTPSEYVEEVKNRAKLQFGDTFLNIGSSIEKFQRKAFWRNLGKYATLFAIFAIFTSFVLAMTGFAFNYFATSNRPTPLSAPSNNQDPLIKLLSQESESLEKLKKLVIELDCQNARKIEGKIVSYDPDLLRVYSIDDCKGIVE